VSRALAVAGCVLALAAQGCGGDDDPADTTAPTPAPAEEDTLWPPPDRATDDPQRVARSFVEEYIGVTDPAISEFVDNGDGTGEIEVHRRGEDGRELAAVVSTLSLRQLEAGGWAVTSAFSAEVELTEPRPLGEIASPVRVAGRGRGFEGNVVLEVREQYAIDPLVQKPVTAGAFEQLEAFSARLAFDTGATLGAMVATTGSGITAADGFAAFPVRFRPG
jgi:hypothetical protein